jgi:hypothetical protein
MCDMTVYDQLDWLPDEVRLTKAETAEILGALRALVQGTEPTEPNRSHVVTIAATLGAAIDRSGGTS